MMSNDHVVRPADGVEPELGSALWMLDDTRARTLASIEGLPASDIDAIPIGGGNTIGALLYHIAAVELSWVYDDILESDHPDWSQNLFPFTVREENGRLSPVRGIPVNEHVGRLATVRDHVRHDLTPLTNDEFRRRRETRGGGTPEWILHHLREHEAEHRGQIQEIRTLLGQGR